MKIAPGIHCIGDQSFVNAYLLEDAGEVTIIDAGLPGFDSGIWGGLIFAGIYIWQSVKAKVPSFAGFLWPALFLSLGWNFFEFAFRANNDGQGVAWGWIVCGVLFFLMGGIPLVVAVQMLTGRRPHRPSSITDIANSIKMAETGISAFQTGSLTIGRP